MSFAITLKHRAIHRKDISPHPDKALPLGACLLRTIDRLSVPLSHCSTYYFVGWRDIVTNSELFHWLGSEGARLVVTAD